MPITVVWPDPSHIIGPGFSLWVHTDLAGPVELGTRFQVSIGLDPEGTNPIMVMTFVAQQHDGFVQVGEPAVTDHQTLQNAVRDGEQVVVLSNLIDPRGNITDSGITTATWSPTAQLWQHVTTTAGQGTGGGFTDSDRQLVTATERRSQVLGEPTDLTWDTASGLVTATLAQIFSRSTLDRLTLTEVTSGPTCEPVRFDVDLWFHTVIVRVTTIGEDLVPKTPDENWYFPDLAVLRVFRGADLEYRRGIHTPTFMAEKPWQWGWWFDSRSPLYGVPPDLHIAVDWRPGCCGQVFLMHLP